MPEASVSPPRTRASVEPSPELLQTALQRLGYDCFRPGQREAIETLIEDGRLLLVAPTGGGKSLIYQLPATILGGTTLVISPLVALMQDQVDALQQQGVAATFLASTLAPDELRCRLAGIAAGEFELVYVAPERLVHGGFRSLLGRLPIPLVAIDEAHCISEWGHDFRPEYLQIGDFIRQLGPRRVLACTATATPVVRDEILAKLGLPPDTPQIVRGFARPNLVLRVAELRSPRQRAGEVDTVLAEVLGGPGVARGTAIIYAPTRKAAQEEAARLGGREWRAAAYHAGMDGKHRERVQRAFMDDRLDVVVATNAFGMGIDRGDVRLVVHLAPPGSLEAYYQEVGRAGRDGATAYGLLLMTPNDVPLRRRLLERSAEEAASPATLEHKWNLFLELMRWAEGGSCRHDAILRYFGDEAETLHGCGRCDVCTSLDGGADRSPEEISLVVRKALSGVARVHNRFGLMAAAKLLRGRADPRIARAGLEGTSTFGVLAEHAEEWIVRLLRRCVTAGWVDFHGDEHPVAFLTEEGKAVMKGQRPARLLLPPVEAKAGRTRAAPKPGGAGSRSAPAPDELDAEATVVFEALRQHRLERARADNVPPYVVASDRTLRDIALLRPRTQAELAMAHGIGPTKLERYGEELLAVVARARSSTPS